MMSASKINTRASTFHASLFRFAVVEPIPYKAAILRSDRGVTSPAAAGGGGTTVITPVELPELEDGAGAGGGVFRKVVVKERF